MTISTTTLRQTYACDGVTVSFAVPFLFLVNAHVFVIRKRISDGANFLLTEGSDYTLTGAGSGSGTVVTSSAISNLYQLIVAREVPLLQDLDLTAHGAIPAESIEAKFDFLTMIAQQLDDRIATLETTSPAGLLTIANVGGGAGIYRDQIGSTYNLKGLVAGANVTITPGADTVTIAATSGGVSYPGSTAQFLRGDGNFSNALTDYLMISAAASQDIIKGYVTGAGANLKRWKVRQSSAGDWGVYAQDDAETVTYAGLEFKRLAGSVDSARLGGRVLIGGGADDAASALQVTGVVALGTPLGIVSGGTGQGSAQNAFNALSQVAGATAGQVVKKVGSDAVWSSPTFLNVVDYMAIGNGIADDTTAIANCFADAAAGGKAVYFPVGTYLTAPIVVGANVTGVFGEGPSKSKLYMKRQAYAANTSMLNFSGSSSSPTLRDIGFDVDNAFFNNTWTVYYGCDNFTARNVHITGQAAIGFMASAGSNMSIERCRAFGTGAAGVAIGVYCDTTATSVIVDAFYQSGVHAYSVNLAAGSFNSIRNCRSFNCSVFAFTHANSYYPVTQGCFAYESGFEGFQFTDVQFGSIIGNRGTWVSAGVDFGISINSAGGIGSKFNTITGNVIDNSYKSGIAIADASDNVVVGNTLRNCGVRGMAAPPQSMMGVYTSAAGKTSVRNRFQDNNCTSEGAAVTYGFLETAAGGSTMDYTSLDNNVFTNVTNQATLVAANSRLSGRFHEGVALIGVLRGANFNSTADQAIRINCGRYRINNIAVENASISLTTAAGGFYTGAAKGGTTLVAAAQAYAACTAANKQTFCTLATGGQDTNTVQTIYLSLTTAQGAAATADIYVYGYQFEAAQ